MFTFIAFVILIFLVISNRSLSSRLEVVEAKLKNAIKASVDDVKTVQPSAMEAPSFVASLHSPESPAILSGKAVADREQTPNKFIIWLKEDWLMKLGAFLFIVGFAWFVSYAFANNWVGPFGRISIGIVAGVIIMALGFWRMIKYPSQGAVFMSLGAGMAMLTIFAGRALFGFFTPASAIFFDFIIAAFVSFASYKFRIQSLAFIAQILAYVTPLLTAGRTESVFLFSYLLVVSLSTLLLAGATGWRNLIKSSLIFVGLYSFPYMASGGRGYSGYGGDAGMILNFAYLFSIIYLLADLFAVLKKGAENVKDGISLALMNGLFIFLWINTVAPEEWGAMILALFAVIFALSSFAVFKLSSKMAPFYAYGSVAVAFIGAATAAELDGTALTVAFIIEVSLLIPVVLLLTKNVKDAIAASCLFIVPAILSFESVVNYATSRELFTEDFFVLVLMAIALIISGRIITYFSLQKDDGKEINAGSLLVVFGTFYIGYIIWEFIHILMIGEPDMATMATLVIYTILGLIAYFAGLYGNDIARRTYGMALLAFVVIRLIFVDVWNMELFGRVITFLVIGILLMSTAFLTKKKKRETGERIVIK